MKPKPEYLQLENSDDVASVRDRLSFLRGKRVLLVWPEQGTVLTRKLDLVLIQREAMRQAVRLAVVTHDPLVMKQARELNISTFETIGESERARWKRGRSKVFVDRYQRPEDEPDAETLKPVASRLQEDEAPEASPAGRAFRVVVLLLLTGLMLAVAVLLVPSAAVTVSPAQERIPVAVSVIADPQATDVDVESSTIPALTLRVEIEDTGTIPTSGSRALSDVPAAGSVVFINQTDGEIQIPADTTVSTSAGTPILFRTTQDAVVPGEVGAQIEVPIEALPDSAGPAGNVDTGLINTIGGDLAASLTVRNLAPTLGGESRTINVVSQDDQDRLLATLRQQLQARAYLGMEAQRSGTQTIILETIQIVEEREDWKTWSAQPGDIADSLTLNMRARVEAKVIDETLAQQIALAALTAEIPPGRALVPNSVTYQCCTVSRVDREGRITLTVTGEGLVSSRVNVGLLQERLSGRSLEDALRYLLAEVDLAEDTRPEITISPDWFGRMPFLPMRITIRVRDTAT